MPGVSAHRGAFTNDNPLNYTDLLGLCGGIFHAVCSVADWTARNATKTSTIITVVAIGTAIPCPECDVLALGLEVASDVYNGIGTYRDIKSGNVTASTIDVLGDLVSLGSLGTSLSALAKATGEGAHIATESKEAFEDADKLSDEWGIASDVGTFTEAALPYLNNEFVGTAC